MFISYIDSTRNTSAHHSREIQTIVEAGFETLQSGTEIRNAPSSAIEPLSNVVGDTDVMVQQPIADPDDESSLLRKRSRVKRVDFSFKTPTSWLGRVYTFTKYQTSCGWDFAFRTYTAIPHSSPIIQYSLSGDIQGLQNIFQSKQASPFVVDEDGWTPLHVSSMT